MFPCGGAGVRLIGNFPQIFSDVNYDASPIDLPDNQRKCH